MACAKTVCRWSRSCGETAAENALGVAGELEQALCHTGSLPDGQPLIVLRRASMCSHERVQSARVHELEPGQIDDQTRHAARLRIKLTVKQTRGGSIERAAQPQDQHVRAALPTDGEPADGRLSGFSDHGSPTGIRRDRCVFLLHARSKRRPKT
jgi:hypothetical protein